MDSGEKQCFNVNALNDDLLFEVLIRLPAKSANQLKCVSRRWNSLISNPNFVSRFIHNRQHHHHHRDLPFTLIFQYTDKKYNEKLCSTSNSKLFKSPGFFSLSFLPCYKPNSNSPIQIVGSYNDLFLGCSSSNFYNSPCTINYFICNPITKQFVEVPPTLRLIKSYACNIGFVCDPVCEQVQEDGCRPSVTVINTTRYRYAIVRVVYSIDIPANFKMEIFSSDTREWSEENVSGPMGFQFTRTNPVVCNQIFYWLCAPGGVFTYNVFEKTPHRFIDWPLEFKANVYNNHLGVCQGRLRLSQFLQNRNEAPTLVIWELREDDVTGTGSNSSSKWCLEHKVSLSEMAASENPMLVKLVKGNRDTTGTILGFHPYNVDIVYLLFQCYGVVLCNIGCGTLKLVHSISLRSCYQGLPLRATMVADASSNHPHPLTINIVRDLNCCLISSSSSIIF